MEASEYKNIFENESTHFFYVANHRIILNLLAHYTRGKYLKILDAGCGTGLLAKKLEKFGQVWGIDISPLAIKFAKKRGVKAKIGSVTQIPFAANSFDLVTSIDVIYHRAVKNDQRALGEFFRVLKPGGLLILRVPAVKWLRNSHDRHVHTRQRYSRRELARKLRRAGFLVKKLSFVNLVLFPPAVARHFWEKLAPPPSTASVIKPIHPLLNSPLVTILSLEALLLKFFNLPFGIGLVAICKK